jgi:hypothetical protein
MTATPTNTAVGGTRSDQILTRIIAGYTVNQAGVVGLGDLLINDTNVDLDAAGGPTTSAATCRTIFEYLSARARLMPGDSSFGFDASWTAGASSTATSKFNLAWNGDAIVLLLNFGVTGGVLTVKNGATTVTTITTSGYTRSFVGSVRLAGFGSGDHELQITLDLGSATINSALIPGSASSAPLIIWDKPAKRLYGSTADTRLATYQAAVQTVADSFGNVLSVDMGAGWDEDTMIGPDLGHRNDRGNAFAAERIHDAVAALGTDYRQGVNRLVNSGAHPNYTAVPATPLVTPPTVLSSDPFTRSDSTSLGSTPVGSLAWTEHTGNDFDIFSNTLRVVTGNSMPACYVNTSNADGTISAKLVTTGGNGLVFRLSSDLTAGYLFYYGSGAYRLMSRTGGSFTLITASSITSQIANDVVEVVLNGSSIICKVNGVTAITTTQTNYQTNTRHGVYISTASGRVDDWLHTIPA